mmetsp:Transcript_90806/g.157476  ORF Transcript_90806/g.157476 Transcript_90806/m.157476 type:complete len:106 (-) Transcript_90806:414-731(-)
MAIVFVKKNKVDTPFSQDSYDGLIRFFMTYVSTKAMGGVDPVDYHLVDGAAHYVGLKLVRQEIDFLIPRAPLDDRSGVVIELVSELNRIPVGDVVIPIESTGQLN